MEPIDRLKIVNRALRNVLNAVPELEGREKALRALIATLHPPHMVETVYCNARIEAMEELIEEMR